MFFSGFDIIERTIIIAIFSYISLVILLRISGKRTLSKLNAFDLVITVAMGSTLSSILLDKNITWAQGTTAFFMLIALQYVIAKLAVHIDWFNKIIKSHPQVLYQDGGFREGAMKKERVPKKAIFQAARSQGIGSMKKIDTVVLESDGSISIIKKSDKEDKDTLDEVKGYK
ncbi:DUF421 domain-containing protein [Rossellomorea vietnamensis]|uniref:DUF421 domain-containing protein n=1 Tax=Rossellomorea vietnamensis TaxID=218284 RepID=A0A5D4NWA5_9BACI|nr:YetF domain-containing protein [Rossellomorea vietnamensis]TYS17606.1 DUF421 domain-containing protein [Rossellomorea vietnamensis]